MSPLTTARPGTMHRCRDCAKVHDLGDTVLCTVRRRRIWEPEEPRYCLTYVPKGQRELWFEGADSISGGPGSA